MKRVCLYAALAAILVLALAFGASAAKIGTAEELVAVMNDPNRWGEDFTLTADIDLTGKAQLPIGNYAKPYSGHFDGNGFTVTVQVIGTECAGLFAVTEGALIENLTVAGEVRNAAAATNAETKFGGNYCATGGVVGIAMTGTSVINCVNKAKVIGPCNLGGVVGIAHNYGVAPVEITDCVNEGELSCTYGNHGGVLGRIQVQTECHPAVSVNGCENRADITYTSNDRARFGGIVGYLRINAGAVILDACRNTGNLVGTNTNKTESNFPNVGGIAGRAEIVSKTSSALQIENCFVSGNVESNKFAGGIIGYSLRASACKGTASFVKNCTVTGSVKGGTYAGGIIGYAQSEDGSEEAPSVIENCLVTASVEAGAAGGILGRSRGVHVENCVFLSGIVSNSANQGGIIGTTAGTEIRHLQNCFYADLSSRAVGVNVEAYDVSGAKAFSLADMAKKDTFAGLDFSAWVMGAKCPVPAVHKAETVAIPEPPKVDGNGPQNGIVSVVYYDSSATNDNDGLTPKTPKMSFGTLSTHCYGLIPDGGTIVTVGRAAITANYTFAKTYGPTTITAVYGGVDYRNAQPADAPAGALRLKNGINLTLVSELTFDNIHLFQEGTKNTLTVGRGGVLVVTDTVQFLAKSGVKPTFTLVIEEKGTAILSKAAMAAFTIENNGGTVVEYTGDATELRLTIGQKTAYVNGEPKALDAAPMIKSGRTMLPVRFVAENLGGTVGWDGATSSVTIKGNGIDIAIKVGAATASINGKTVTLDAPAFIESGRTYLPVRVVAEAMGATVAWDGATSTATLVK